MTRFSKSGSVLPKNFPMTKSIMGKVSVPNDLQYIKNICKNILCLDCQYIVCTPLSAGGWVEPPTKFSESPPPMTGP